MKTHLLFVSFFFLSTFGYAQFITNGTAKKIKGKDNCFRLTEEKNTQAGSVWYQNLINLNESFEGTFTLNFGELDADGADGIAFVLQPLSTAEGTNGGGIGYMGIKPSVDIEFDTWSNSEYNDPAYDHVAIMKDGNVNHGSLLDTFSLAGPVGILPDEEDAETGEDHLVHISWEAAAKKLSVYVDCEFRLSYTGDIVKDIFKGNPKVYMGFTAATGGAFNLQTVCFNYFSGIEVFNLPDTSICRWGSVQLSAPKGFASYQWLPNKYISNPAIYNPVFSPETSTTYTLTMTDNCGNKVYDTVHIEVVPYPYASFNYTKEDRNVYFHGTNKNGVNKWFWDFGDRSPTSTEQNPVHEYLQKETFTVTLIVWNDCASDTTLFDITIDGTNGEGTTGIGTAETNLSEFRIAPNPFSDQLTIHFRTEEQETVAISLFDMLGREVYQLRDNRILLPGTHDYVVEADQLRGQGFYYLTISGGQQVYTQKVVLVR